MTIYPYSYKDGAFSVPGDSGSIIADANNRIVGMITGGAGKDDDTDVTHASLYYLLGGCIRKAFTSTRSRPGL